LLRTHFSDAGQSRLRLVLGVAYTFGARKAEVAEAKVVYSENKSKTDHDAAVTSAEKTGTEQHEADKQELRARLLENFNRVLPTTDTDRGLVVNMANVLFDVGKSDLQPEGREDLAKLSGIIINYPKLRLTVEGHTDNTGTAELNQTLSEQRANTVREYLVKQGLDANSLSAQGLGENNPVADNSTPEGRDKNRRVEIIVSGEILGTKIGRK
jgi:outer membrane protein OmpA-like peptidoglycan-associated protein